MTKNINKPNGIGLGRIIKASQCSVKGFIAAYNHESAFRQELLLTAIMLPFSFVIANDSIQLALLIVTLLLVLLVEILNSAIEAVVDRISLEQNPLSGRAKDLGSAAAFLALTICSLIWLAVIYQNYFSLSS